jgi:hypothetical protein
MTLEWVAIGDLLPGDVLDCGLTVAYVEPEARFETPGCVDLHFTDGTAHYGHLSRGLTRRLG